MSKILVSLFCLCIANLSLAMCLGGYDVKEMALRKRSTHVTSAGLVYANPDVRPQLNENGLTAMCKDRFGDEYRFDHVIDIREVTLSNPFIEFALHTLHMATPGPLQRFTLPLIRHENENIIYGCIKRLSEEETEVECERQAEQARTTRETNRPMGGFIVSNDNSSFEFSEKKESP